VFPVLVMIFACFYNVVFLHPSHPTAMNQNDMRKIKQTENNDETHKTGGDEIK